MTGGIHVCSFETIRGRGGLDEPVCPAVEQRGDLLQVGPGPRVTLCVSVDPLCHRPCGLGDPDTDPQVETAASRQAHAVRGGNRVGAAGGLSDFLSAGPGPQRHPRRDGDPHGCAADPHRSVDGAPAFAESAVWPGAGVGGADHGGLPGYRFVRHVVGGDAVRVIGAGQHDLRLGCQCSLLR